MKPYTDKEAGRQLLLYGTVFIMARKVPDGTELLILDQKEVKIEELQDEQKL